MPYPLRTDWGVPFPVPRLVAHGILVGDWLYDYVEGERQRAVLTSDLHQGQLFGDGLVPPTPGDLVVGTRRTTVVDRAYQPVVRAVDSVFTGSKYAVPVKTDAYGTLRVYPGNAHNLRRLAGLPFVSAADATEALDYLCYWHHELPRACMRFMDEKIAAMMTPAPDLGPMHHRCVKSSEVTIVTTRKPTSAERARLFRGEVIDLSTREIQTTTQELYSEWYGFAVTKLPYSQQVLAAAYLYNLRRIPLWFDVRTGKSLVVTMVLRRLFAEGQIDYAFIICPKGIIYSAWVRENLDPERMPYHVLEDSRTEDAAALRAAPPGTTFVLNYERLEVILDLLEDEFDLSRVAVAADETYSIKNPAASRAKSFARLGAHRELALLTGLNGTPGEQGPQDHWSFYHALDPLGTTWGATFSEFTDTRLEKMGTRYTIKDPTGYQVLMATTSLRYTQGEADQFSGKSASFRYVYLPMTHEVREAGRNIALGFVKDAEGNKEFIKQHMLSVMTRLREVCVGTDKYGDAGSGFFRTHHETDAKLLWVQCFLAADPTAALVIFCEFNEAEDRLKLMLNEMGVEWRSTRELPRKVRRPRLPPMDRCLDYMVTDLYRRLNDWVAAGGWGLVVDDKVVDAVPPADCTDPVGDGYVRKRAYPGMWEELRYHTTAIECFRAAGHGYLLDYYDAYEGGKKLSPSAKSQAEADFNEGRAQIYILKNDEGRGIRLNRREAVAAHAGRRPAIICLAPTWKLGTWEQEINRCMDTDFETKKSVHTMVYVLVIRGSIESQMLSAIRQKKEIAEFLLQDAARQGYTSFVTDMALGESKLAGPAVKEDDAEYFDAEDMRSRIRCGVPPYSKLSVKLIRNKLVEKLGLKNVAELDRWLTTPPDDLDVGIVLDLTSLDAKLEDRSPEVAQYWLTRAAYTTLLSRVADAQES